ncbi:MAG: septal ring lytic transglycosylase RlpA family protein [Pseudomonadota bacterium]|nr:septal ring lytic transglycosylase RlpA family protein [Pseudomonadota bacterium]
MTRTALAALILTLAACSGAPKKSPPPAAKVVNKSPPVAAMAARRSPYAPAQEDLRKRGDYVAEGLYAPHIRDGAPSQDPQVDLIPDVQPKDEPRSLYGNRPYKVLGVPYSVMGDEDARRYSETGMASWYGAKFHGRRTSSLEVYDMYTFSGAHKTLPLPSYVRVTNLDNGKSLVVRVNDRGPFHPGRIIDLSYAAAMKLGVNRTGTAKVHVQSLNAEHVDVDTRVASIAAPARAMPQVPPVANELPATGVVTTAIDTLVAALPIGGAVASDRKPTVTPTVTPQASDNTATPTANTDYRFDMRQDGRAMTAAEFDAWMQARRVRVATGKPGQPDTGVRASAALPTPAPAITAALPSAVTQPSIPSATVSGGVILQVASFASQQNAGRALAMLQGAGIGGARLQEAQVNGQTVWRLRVGPLDGVAATELSSRISGLGFGAPRIVRD